MAEPSTSVMPDASERRLAGGLIVLSLAWALVVGSNLFQISSWIVGDIAYHRGVAYTMQGIDWQGEGPYAGACPRDDRSDGEDDQRENGAQPTRKPGTGHAASLRPARR